jgi:hypothetical protein
MIKKTLLAALPATPLSGPHLHVEMLLMTLEKDKDNAILALASQAAARSAGVGYPWGVAVKP